MGSSEILGSGRVRSNFSRTCNRLSRYLKEKGSFGNFDRVFNPRNMESKETMNLFPMMDKGGQNQIHVKSCVLSVGKHVEPQMTIFYGGRIVVFDDLSADKAKEIVMLAGKLSAGAPRAAAAQERDGPPLQPALLDSDPPIARKNTLSRFLEKRKDRVTENAPYTAVKPSPVKGEGSPWLGLMPMQIPRNYN